MGVKVLGERNVEEGSGGEGGEREEGENSSCSSSSKRKSAFVGNSYAAKYRALKAVKLVAPTEALEALLPDFAPGCTLDKLCFAAFVATKMEAMQLPLPCAGLAELSKFDFSNLARALWKDHGLVAGKGELLEEFHMLLVKLLVENGVADPALLKTVVESIAAMGREFPGGLLKCCRLLVERVGGGGGGMLKGLVKEVGRLIADEIGRMKPQPQGYVRDDFVSVGEVREVVDGLVGLVVRLGVVGGGGGGGKKSDWSGMGVRLLGLVGAFEACYFDEGDKKDARECILDSVVRLGCECKGEGGGRRLLWEGVKKEGGGRLLRDLVGGWDEGKVVGKGGGWENVMKEEIGLMRELREVVGGE